MEDIENMCIPPQILAKYKYLRKFKTHEKSIDQLEKFNLGILVNYWRIENVLIRTTTYVTTGKEVKEKIMQTSQLYQLWNTSNWKKIAKSKLQPKMGISKKKYTDDQ